jgi:hypothetical protein
MFLNLLRRRFAKHLSQGRPRLQPQARLGLESLGDRVAPAILTLPSPNSHWVATVEGTPGIEWVQVSENGSGRLVYHSGGYQGIDHLTWSPNSLEVAWVQQSGANVTSRLLGLQVR